MDGIQWENLLQRLADPDCRQLLVAIPEADADILGSRMLQEHLPQLEKNGYITWHREMGTIIKGPKWNEIGPLFELIQNHREELPKGWL